MCVYNLLPEVINIKEPEEGHVRRDASASDCEERKINK